MAQSYESPPKDESQSLLRSGRRRPSRLRIHLRWKKLATARLGGRRPPRAVAIWRSIKEIRMRSKWATKKLNELLGKDIGDFNAFLKRILMEISLAVPVLGLVNDGWYYFQFMKELFGIDPGREHYGCIIDLLGRAGRLDEAVTLIHEMKHEPDAVTWRILLGACRVHKNVDLAVYAAKEILKLNPADAGTYILLSNIYDNSKKWEDVAEVRRTMRTRGVKKEPGCSWVEMSKQVHAFILGDNSHPRIEEIKRELSQLIQRLLIVGYVPDTNFVLQDIEGEQMEDSLQYHGEKLAIVFGLMSFPNEKTIHIRKNLRICENDEVTTNFLKKTEQHRGEREEREREEKWKIFPFVAPWRTGEEEKKDEFQ